MHRWSTDRRRHHGSDRVSDPTPDDWPYDHQSWHDPAVVPGPAVECPGVEWVGFYGLSEYDRRDFRDPDTARIGFTMAGGKTVFFVAYVDGEVAGASEMRFERGGSVTGDGAEVELDEPLSGVHTIRVVAHADVNGNQVFEPETDLPCRYDGEVVQTGMERLNFGELAGTSTPETTG